MTFSSGSASPRARLSHRLWLSRKANCMVQLVTVLVAEVLREVLQLGVHLTEQHRVATPPAPEGAQAAQPAPAGRHAPASTSPEVSSRNGTASMRKPETPRASQKPMIRAISSRTAGLATLRSG